MGEDVEQRGEAKALLCFTSVMRPRKQFEHQHRVPSKGPI